jgi:hypothetical protein
MVLHRCPQLGCIKHGMTLFEVRYDNELFASVPSAYIHLTRAVFYYGGDLPDDGIAELMSPRIVELLEMIYVYEKAGECAPVSPYSLEFESNLS